VWKPSAAFESCFNRYWTTDASLRKVTCFTTETSSLVSVFWTEWNGRHRAERATLAGLRWAETFNGKRIVSSTPPLIVTLPDECVGILCFYRPTALTPHILFGRMTAHPTDGRLTADCWSVTQ